MRRTATLLVLLLLFYWASGQNGSSYWTTLSSESHTITVKYPLPEKYQLLEVQEEILMEKLAAAPLRDFQKKGLPINLPNPVGQAVTFLVWETPMMQDGLARLFPGFATYSGTGQEDRSAYLKLDITSKGIHAIVFSAEGTWLIDPVMIDGERKYISYFKKDYTTPGEFTCLAEDEEVEETPKSGPTPVGEELRTYRLAMAATGEYTQYHGGTLEDGMAAIVTLMNRVNGVYERDFAATMILVDSNHLIVYTDHGSDPYSGNNNLGENQQNVDNVIGNENYDIGHLIDLGGGGVANYRSLCDDGSKAQGYTGLNPPEGDPFAIDYVSHEIGHQYGGSHTFNGNAGACGGNRSGGHAFEPGSGTTIMAYAGICGNQNTAFNSDDHFHVGSLEEIVPFIQTGGGNSCATITPTGNTPPVVDPGPGGHVIPVSTPFELIGSATDMEDDSLTFIWEQVDLGPAGSPNAPVGNAPLFRSFRPVNEPYRIFPRIQDVLNNNNTFGELLPTYSRDLTFRLAVRDNHPMGGGNDWEEVSMEVAEEAGPFVVFSPLQPVIWNSGGFGAVTWDVANTDLPPVNATEVDIYLSKDGGFTFPILVAEDQPNNGSVIFIVPDTLQGSNFRVKVKGSDNVFFNINGADITLSQPEDPDVEVGVLNNLRSVCAPEEAIYTFPTIGLLGFDDTLTVGILGLPEELTTVFESEQVIPSEDISFTVSGTGNLPSGTYPFELLVSDETSTDTILLSLFIAEGAPSGLVLLEPAESAVDVATSGTVFSWQGSPDAEHYELQIASDEGFSNIIYDNEEIQDTFFILNEELSEDEVFYWRIRGFSSLCGYGPFTEGNSFLTETLRCDLFESEDVPVSFNTFSFIISQLEIEEDYPIRDLNIIDLNGTYFPISDLRFLLSSPEGTSVEIVPRKCQGGLNFSLSLDDEATDTIPCPYNMGETYLPGEPLTAFNGESTVGSWRLTIFDDAQFGLLKGWGLEICYPAQLVNSQEVLAQKKEQRITVFPNPGSGQFSVVIESTQVDRAQFVLRDMAGKEIRVFDKGRVFRGKNQLDLNLEGLSNGLYILQWIGEGGSILDSSRLILIK